MSILGRGLIGLLAAAVVVGTTALASAAMTKHEGKTVGGTKYKYTMFPPGTGILSNCLGMCEASTNCFGFTWSAKDKNCTFVKRPLELFASGLTSNAGVDFYEKVVTKPGTREVKCTVPGAEAHAAALAAGYGFECFLYDHTINPANIISSSQRFDLVGAMGPRALGTAVGCAGTAPAGFQTLYLNLFRNRQLKNGWVLDDYHVHGDAWAVGPVDSALIRLKSTRQYKKGEQFSVRLADLVLKNTKTGWFFCEDAPKEAFQ